MTVIDVAFRVKGEELADAFSSRWQSLSLNKFVDRVFIPKSGNSSAVEAHLILDTERRYRIWVAGRDQFSCQPLWVVQPDAVCEVGGSTPGISHGDLGIFLGGGQTEEFVH